MLIGLELGWGQKIAPLVCICPSWTENNTKHTLQGSNEVYHELPVDVGRIVAEIENINSKMLLLISMLTIMHQVSS